MVFFNGTPFALAGVGLALQRSASCLVLPGRGFSLAAHFLRAFPLARKPFESRDKTKTVFLKCGKLTFFYCPPGSAVS